MVDLKIKIPEGFLCEEEICGYTVTRNVKQLWAVELDLMAQLDAVCKKHGLTYIAGAGTLLGAVRHHGFIPWDDDMDFYLLREDYDKLLSFSYEFKEPYFLQNMETEAVPGVTFTRLRNCNTTATTVRNQHLRVNNGVFIDIFPLDGVNECFFPNLIQQIRDIYYKSCMRNLVFDFRGLSQKKKIKRMFANIPIALLSKKNKKLYFRKYNENLKRYSISGTKTWGNRTLVFNCPRSRRPIEDWRQIKYVPFEFTEIPIPENYDEMLQQQYGDYMTLPSDKKTGKMHGELLIYTEADERGQYK